MLNNNNFVNELARSGITYREIQEQIKTVVHYPEGILAESEREQKETALELLATNLTKLAREGKLDPIIGRDEEIVRVVNILARRSKNNPIIVGESGVGKTAIVEGLAQKIANGEVSSVLAGYEIWSLDTASLVAGSQMRGELEAKVLALIDEISQRGNVILFIDEIHDVLDVGSMPGSVSVGSVLNPALAKGRLHCIGATTPTEYSKIFTKNPGMARRFQPVFVEELKVEETIKILERLKPIYELFHNVSIDDEAIKQSVKLSARYIADRFLPDKAIDILDEASARARVGKLFYTPKFRELAAKLRDLQYKKNKLMDSKNYEEAAKVREEENRVSKELIEYKRFIRKKWKKQKSKVTVDDIRNVVSEWTGIPVETITVSEAKKLMSLEKKLKSRIVGQLNAIRAVVSAVKRARTGIAEERRPLASLLFLGPTGVGKTELAKQLAIQLFGDLNSFIQVDMSEMMEPHSVSKLIGAPPGYVGFDYGGQLTEKIWRHPYSVVLFDEIEKAHPDVLNILLQVLEEGHLTDGRGRRVNFKNSVIIMTSNIGAEEIGANEELGFKVITRRGLNELKIDRAYEQMKEKILSKLRERFRPEFLNRIDEIVIFRVLTKDEVRRIVGIQISDLNKRLEEKGIKVELSPAMLKAIATEGYSEAYGARPVKRQIQEKVENPLADYILKVPIKKGSVVLVDIKDNKPVLSVKTNSTNVESALK